VRFLRIIAIAWLTLCGSAAAGADPAVTVFVTKIYDSYKGKDSKGVSIGTEAEIRRLFEPSLAALIARDQKAAAKRGDVGTLDGDPFIDAQDWDIPAFDVAVNDLPPGKAVATVTFRNIGEPVKIVLNLVKVGNDWRIADIIWTRKQGPTSLRSLFVKR
jgi:hypothetical protein